jgi:hypothetical protein
MNRLKNIIVFLIFFLLTLGVMDVIIRFARIESLAKTEVDLKRGKILKPDQYSVYFNEGFYVGKPNRYGFYGPAYSIEKPDKTFRIALAGDSYIAGTQLFERYHFRTLLEEKLKSMTGMNIQILNFGRAGLDFDDMYCLYKNFIEEFSPDISIFFVAKNDFENDHKDPLLPQCEIDKEGNLLIKADFINSRQYLRYQKYGLLVDNSSLIKLLANCKKYFDKGETGRILFDKFYRSEQEKSSDIETEEDFVVSDLNRKIIAELKETPLVIMSRNEIPHQIHDIFKLNGIKLHKFYQIFDEMEKNGVDPIYWNVTGKRGHWNHAAHKRVSEYLSEILIKIIREKDGLE